MRECGDLTFAREILLDDPLSSVGNTNLIGRYNESTVLLADGGGNWKEDSVLKQVNRDSDFTGSSILQPPHIILPRSVKCRFLPLAGLPKRQLWCDSSRFRNPG